MKKLAISLITNKTKKVLLMSLTLLLLDTALADTEYKAEVFGDATLAINGKFIQAKNHQKFTFREGDLICLLSENKSEVSIDAGKGNKLTLSSKCRPCIHLQNIPEQRWYGAIGMKITQLFTLPKRGEETREGQHRGSEFADNYKESIYLYEKEYLVIETDKWVTSNSTLPIVLQLISMNDKVELEFKSYSRGFTSFIIPKKMLLDKDGYRLKVENNREEIKIDSTFYLSKPSGRS